MKRVVFELSMPNNNSWNGRWSGEGNKYTVAKKMTDAKYSALKTYYYYSFGDGWAAGVSVRLAMPREKTTEKFCGYNWMIDSILRHGDIRA